GRAVVVDDAADPAAAHVRQRAVGQDRRVLARDVGLVVEAVGHPAPQLLGAQRPLVHPPVERVQRVVSLGLGAQRGHELVGGEGCRHIWISMPSTATSMPWSSTMRRSRESSRRTGLVLLTWM